MCLIRKGFGFRGSGLVFKGLLWFRGSGMEV